MRKSRSHIKIISSSSGTDVEKYWPLEMKKKNSVYPNDTTNSTDHSLYPYHQGHHKLPYVLA